MLLSTDAGGGRKNAGIEEIVIEVPGAVVVQHQQRAALRQAGEQCGGAAPEQPLSQQLAFSPNPESASHEGLIVA